MKKLVFILFLSVGFEMFAQSDCSPMLKEIYGFEIGDVFNYKYTTYDWSTGTGTPDTRTHFLDFEVKDKLIKGDTLLYVINGYLPPTTVTQFDYEPFVEREYTDTLILIDSVNHNLNQCVDSIIKFQFPQEDSVFSKVIIKENDISDYKVLGGMNNLFQFDNNELVSFFDFNYEEKYVANLGLVYQYFSLFERTEKVELASYVKDGDTTNLITSVDFNSKEIDFKLYPNPVRDKLTLNLDEYHGELNIKVIDSRGRLIADKKFISKNDSYSIDFSSISTGLYSIEVRSDKQIISQRILKQ